MNIPFYLSENTIPYCVWKQYFELFTLDENDDSGEERPPSNATITDPSDINCTYTFDFNNENRYTTIKIYKKGVITDKYELNSGRMYCLRYTYYRKEGKLFY